MHQTFYIDIDEEITSIVERLRRSTAKEVVIVVPKRALLIQSIINLKLLKKEADELNKKIIIVTQDKFGKLMIEKTGISVEQKLDDISGEEMVVTEKVKHNDNKTLEKLDPEVRKNGENQLDKIGSSGFFDSDISKNKKIDLTVNESFQINNEKKDRLTKKEPAAPVASLIKERKKSNFKDSKQRTDAPDSVRNMDIKQGGSDDIRKKDVMPSAGTSDYAKKQGIKLKIGRASFKKEKLPEKYEQTEDFDIVDGVKRGSAAPSFSSQDQEEGKYQDISLPKRSWKIFLISGLVVVLAVLFSASYLFLPKAKVIIFSKTKIISVDAEVKADANPESVNPEAGIIPSRVISVSEETSGNFKASGSKGASSHKARGMITIYNEYSSANQPLVATTRFLSEDGKLFRLVNSIVVPGVTIVGTESKPGAIEAEVVADEAGEEFNIGPTKFSIPGFQGSGNEKYAKIYAKSFKVMAGGGTGEETVRTVTDADINSAKNQALSGINSKIKEKLKIESGDGYVLLDESMNFGDPVYKISNSAGDTTDNFTVDLKLDAKAIVFREADLKSVLESIIKKNMGEGKQVVEGSITQEFGKAEADFTNAVLGIKIHVGAKIAPILELETIKKGILGKNKSELEAYLKPYSDISKVEVEYWPSFIYGKIPQYDSRVEIELDNN